MNGFTGRSGPCSVSRRTGGRRPTPPAAGRASGCDGAGGAGGGAGGAGGGAGGAAACGGAGRAGLRRRSGRSLRGDAGRAGRGPPAGRAGGAGAVGGDAKGGLPAARNDAAARTGGSQARRRSAGGGGLESAQRWCWRRGRWRSAARRGVRNWDGRRRYRRRAPSGLDRRTRCCTRCNARADRPRGPWRGPRDTRSHTTDR